jgi:glycosyltransferase involved in cell wall biosynthesis
MSNLYGPGDWSTAACRITRVDFPKGGAGWVDRLRYFFRSSRCDYLILEHELSTLMLYGVLQWVLPFHRCRLVSVDTKLAPPRGFKARIAWRLKIIGLRGIHLHVLHFRDTGELCRVYRLQPERIRYVPFRVAQFEEHLTRETRDDGYVFAGGHSRRDYPTFFEAIRGLDLPVRVMAGDEKLLRDHNSLFDPDGIPPGVEFITDYDPGRFSELLLAARLVVVPTRGDILVPAGLAVYLEAMAYRKCVVATSGPGVNGLLDGQALVIPPGDAVALREAIGRAYHDEAYREAFAERGLRYAIEIGTGKKIYQSVAEVVCALAVGEHGSESDTEPRSRPGGQPPLR